MDDRLRTTLEVLGAGILTIVPAILTYYSAKKAAIRQAKLDELRLPVEIQTAAGEAANKVASGYERLVMNMQTRLTELEKRQTELECEVEKQEKRIKYLENGIRKLVDQIKKAGGTPAFTIEGEE